jgi:hypothetical protein
MTPLSIIDRLDRAGVVLTVNGDKLTYDAPAGTMTPDLLGVMRHAKPILLAMVAGDWCAAVAAMIGRLPDPDQRADLRFQFEERAGICEHDGGLSRREAERIAYGEIAPLVIGSTTVDEPV